MIVFSAITPHPPLLIPEIGKENLRFVEKTSKSMLKLAEELYASKPETIVIISPHGPMLPDAFAINMSQDFTVSFKEFGDLSTEIKIKGDIGLIHHYKEILEAQLPVILVNRQELDHGAGIPLYFFMKGLKQTFVQIVPISYSLLDFNSHYTFGMKLQEDMINDTKRIAVIASGDLSHRLTKDAPAGFSAWGKKFDETVAEKIRQRDAKGLMALDPQFIEEAGECGLRSIIILLGMLNSIQYEPEIYSYEGPFGVGYMVANLKIPR
ncbi:MAG: class III extradiol dioxygenase subunit B-like domain-containing protein [Patescibacteria group bacterium]|nr:class III extradiol dioxygenase subunit B-like domain-containing protein [Patescibacteria group bacterium]